MGMIKSKLNAIIDLAYGKSLPERKRILGKFPVIGSGGVVGFHNTFLCQGPGIIIGRKGSIGTVHFIKDNFYPIDTVFYVVPKNKKMPIKYIYYLLSQLNLSMLNTDAAVPGLNRAVALSQNVNFSTNEVEQRKITKFLSNYDDLIENNNRRIKILEEMAQKIYKEWFVDFKFPRHETTTFKDSPLGKIPNDWEVGKLQDIVEFFNGYAFKSKELLKHPQKNSLSVFKQGHINRGGGFNYSGTKSWFPREKSIELKKYILKKGDLLMAMTDMKNNVAILGNTAIMPMDNSYILNQRVGLLRCKNNLNISYH